MTIPQKTASSGDIMETVLLKGDLAKLTPRERVDYYGSVCKSLGLNPLTQPFAYITLNGKLQLYALRACADQLRRVNGVSLEIVSREIADDVLTIHVRARLPDGRSDEDLGAVAFPPTLKGEARVNAELKAVTKAKRRATLSICGLGWLDETEVDSIPGARTMPAHNPETGEITDKPAAISEQQAQDLAVLIENTGGDVTKFCAFAEIGALADLPATRYEAMVQAIKDAHTARLRKAALAKAKKHEEAKADQAPETASEGT